jgi:hypothetical protein
MGGARFPEKKKDRKQTKNGKQNNISRNEAFRCGVKHQHQNHRHIQRMIHEWINPSQATMRRKPVDPHVSPVINKRN